MSIYITGDTHGRFERFSKKSRGKLPFTFTGNDYVIICGDFGLLWEYDKEYKYNIDCLSRLPFKILWVQGNHENYNMISDFPLEEWHSGKARHIVRDKIILLERGQIFEIEDKTFFTFGGAESNEAKHNKIIDKRDENFKQKKKLWRKYHESFRILDESWWKQELPTQEEMQTGLDNLRKVDYKVDYVITHCASSKAQDIIDLEQNKKESNILTKYFDTLEEKVEFKEWYFGHYHYDNKGDSKHKAVYKEIIKIER